MQQLCNERLRQLQYLLHVTSRVDASFGLPWLEPLSLLLRYQLQHLCHGLLCGQWLREQLQWLREQLQQLRDRFSPRNSLWLPQWRMRRLW